MKRAELLVLDDLGAERATEWAREVMLIIVSARLAGRRQTVITTNYSTAGELVERFGGGKEGMRIVSRLFGLCEPVRLEGPDWRLGFLLKCENGNERSVELRHESHSNMQESVNAHEIV